jgi:hypothetical protein
MTDRERLLNKVRPVSFATAYRMLSSISNAEDVVQEALLAVATKATGGWWNAPATGCPRSVRTSSSSRRSCWHGWQPHDLGFALRNDAGGSWMPVGTNGCHQSTESPAMASPERPYPQGIWGYPEQPVRSRVPSQPTDQSAGQARTGVGAVRSRDCLEAQVTAPREEPQNPTTGWSGGQRQPGAVMMSAGRGAADRLGLDPGQGTRRERGRHPISAGYR